jgi:hypothetical protein
MELNRCRRTGPSLLALFLGAQALLAAGCKGDLGGGDSTASSAAAGGGSSSSGPLDTSATGSGGAGHGGAAASSTSGGTGGSATPPPPMGTPAPKVITILQGQSNAVFLQYEKAYYGIYSPLVQALTGIPDHVAEAVRSDFSDPDKGYTLASGTPTYAFDDSSDQLWLDANAAGADHADPSTWPTGTHGTAFQNFIKNSIVGNAPDGVPVVVLRFHSEYDSKKSGDEAKVYGAANRRFIALARSWIGKPAHEVPVFLGMPGFWSGTTSEALDSIRDAWRADIADPGNNEHWMFGNVYDGNDRGDASHMDEAGDEMAAGRMALSVSRWLYDNGYAHNDLSWLPRLGPRITQVRRVPGQGDAVDVVIQHDRGTDLVIPGDPALDVVSIHDDGTERKATSIARVDATTLRITLDGALTGSDAQVTFDYNFWPGYYGPGRLVTDNWQSGVARPDWAKSIPDLDGVALPVRRLDQSLVLGQKVSDPAAP